MTAVTDDTFGIEDIDAEWHAHWSRSCAGKVKLGHGAAVALVTKLRREGTPRDAYRCQFGEHWHVGHPLTVRSLERIAQVMRARIASR